MAETAPAPVGQDPQDALVVHLHCRPGQPRAPHWHHRLRHRRCLLGGSCYGSVSRIPSMASGAATPSPPGTRTSPPRERAMPHPFQSCSATTSSAWTRSASSRDSSTRRRAARSHCSSNPETDGIRGLPEKDRPPLSPNQRSYARTSGNTSIMTGMKQPRTVSLDPVIAPQTLHSLAWPCTGAELHRLVRTRRAPQALPQRTRCAWPAVSGAASSTEADP